MPCLLLSNDNDMPLKNCTLSQIEIHYQNRSPLCQVLHNTQARVPLLQTVVLSPPHLTFDNLYLRNYKSLQVPYHTRLG